MTLRTIIKVALALGGIVLFGAGLRMDVGALRWAGLACVAAAWLLRFSRDVPPTDDA